MKREKLQLLQYFPIAVRMNLDLADFWKSWYCAQIAFKMTEKSCSFPENIAEKWGWCEGGRL